MTRHTRNLGQPDEVVELDGMREDAVEIGDFTVAGVVSQPGWRWSLHMKAAVGTDWCEAHQVGWQLSGRTGFLLRDGTTYEIAPNDGSTCARASTSARWRRSAAPSGAWLSTKSRA